MLITAFTQMAAVFRYRLTDEHIDALCTALDDLQVEHVRDACADICKHERFFPRPVVIRSYVQRIVQQRTPRATPAPAFTADGESALWACLACQDRGFRPVNDHGDLMSWDMARGVGAYLQAGKVHVHHVVPCRICNKFPEPPPKHTKPTFDDEQDAKRGARKRSQFTGFRGGQWHTPGGDE